MVNALIVTQVSDRINRYKLLNCIYSLLHTYNAFARVYHGNYFIFRGGDKYSKTIIYFYSIIIGQFQKQFHTYYTYCGKYFKSKILNVKLVN